MFNQSFNPHSIVRQAYQLIYLLEIDLREHDFKFLNMHTPHTLHTHIIKERQQFYIIDTSVLAHKCRVHVQAHYFQTFPSK